MSEVHCRRGGRRALVRSAAALAMWMCAPWAGAAGPGLDSAVMVETGFKMDVVSQSMSYEYESWTLFDDGSAYKQLPTTALEDFDVARSRKARPVAWGQWRRQGDKLEVRWPASGQAKDANWSVARRWFALTVAGEGSTLNAVYTVLGRSAQKGLFETSFATGWRQITFKADGRFEQQSGGSASDSQAAVGSVLSAAVATAEGRYRIQGPMLELRFEDGRTLRGSLFFSGSDQKTMLLNGARWRLQRRL